MHYLALIVTQEKVEMWVDAEKKFEGPLKRPVTDCSGSALEIGLFCVFCEPRLTKYGVFWKPDLFCLFCGSRLCRWVRLCVTK